MEPRIQQLKHYFSLEEQSADLYLTRKSWINSGGRGVYGGQMLSQALAVAAMTLDEGFLPHSLHCYFILAGKADVPMYFEVDRVRDGKSFATRVVNIKQNNKTIFTLTCSFQKLRSNKDLISHQYAMPDVYPVDSGELIGESSLKNANMRMGGFVIDQKVTVMGTLPVDSRLAVPKDPELRKNFDLGVNDYIDKIAKSDTPLNKSQIRLPYNYRWIRIDDNLVGVHPTVHICMLACLSDFRILMTASLPHFWGYNYNKNQLNMSVSLDHTLHFHAPVKADSWLLWVVESPRVCNGRGYIISRFYDESGIMVASAVQEALFRAQAKLTSAENSLSFKVPPPTLEQIKHAKGNHHLHKDGAHPKL